MNYLLLTHKQVKKISMDDPNVGLYLYKFNKINLVTTDRTANRSATIINKNTSQFKKKHIYIQLNNVYAQIQLQTL